MIKGAASEESPASGGCSCSSGPSSTLVGELARGAIVELATDAVEGAARVRISAPLEGWVTARLLEPLSSPEEPIIAPLSPPTEVDGPERQWARHWT